MHVQLVDPSAYTPPYDHALARGLTRAGAEVDLVTSRFVHGVTPAADGYRLDERFYRRATSLERGRTARRLLRAAEHVPGMLSLRGRGGGADVRHYQWLPLEPIDTLLLPPARPRVFTVHNVLRRAEGRLQQEVTRRLVDQMDAVVVHTRAGADDLVHRFGADRARVNVIPHGVFDYLTRLPNEVPLPDDLAEVEGPVILCFGLVRPYKGVEVLLEAFEELEGAELWIVGLPHVPMQPLRDAAARARGRVRFVERFVTDPEIAAFFRRADLVVLPYRRIDQSGVLYTALAFSKALVLSDVGGFSEVGREYGAARLVPPEDPAALRDALAELVADPVSRETLERHAGAAASGPFSWDDIGRQTLALYERLVAS